MNEKQINLIKRENNKFLFKQNYAHITPLQYIKKLSQTGILQNHNYFPEKGFPLHNLISTNTNLILGQIGLRGMLEEMVGKEIIKKISFAKFPIKLEELEKNQKLINYILEQEMKLTTSQATKIQSDAIDNNYAFVFLTRQETVKEYNEIIYLDKEYITADEILGILPGTKKAREQVKKFF